MHNAWKMRSAMRVTCCLWLVAICSGVPACRDTDGHSKDMNGGAAVASKDMNGDGCADYKHPNHCKEPFDDDDFSSSSMCCLCGGGTSAAPEETIVSLPREGAAPTASPEASVPLSSAEVEQVESALGGLVGAKLSLGLGSLTTTHFKPAEKEGGEDDDDEVCASVAAGGMLELRGPRAQPQEWCNILTNQTECERAYVRQTQTVWPCEWPHDPSKRRSADAPCQTFGGTHLCPSLLPLAEAVAADDGCTEPYGACRETHCCKDVTNHHGFSCMRRPDRYYAQCRPAAIPAHAPGSEAAAVSCEDSPEWLCPGWEQCAKNYAECTRSRCCAGIEFGCYLDVNDTTSGWHAYCRPKAEMEQAKDLASGGAGGGGGANGSGGADLRWVAVANATNEDGTWAWVIDKVGEKAHALHHRIVAKVEATSSEAIAAIVVGATLVAACALCCALRYRHRMLERLERLEERLATLQTHGVGVRATRDEGAGLMAEDPETGGVGAADGAADDGLGGTELVDGGLVWEKRQPQQQEEPTPAPAGEEEPVPARVRARENGTPAANIDEPPPWWPAAAKNGH